MRSLLAWLLALGALVAAELPPTVQVSASRLWADPNGYSPIAIQVDSLAATTLHITIVAGDTRAASTFAVSAGSSRHSLLLPPHAGEWFGSIDLVWRAEDGQSGRHEHLRTLFDDEEALLLVDPQRAFDESVLPQSMDAWRGSHHYHGTPTYKHVEAQQLPDRWQAYREDHVLLLHRSGVDVLSAAQRQAIDDWVRLGGIAGLVGGEPAALGIPSVERVADVESWLVGAGEERRRLTDYDPPAVPVPGTEEVPVGIFALLAVCFALVAGPLNLWWAIRRRQRWLLLVSTPALSVATCVVLVVVNLISEGVTTRRVATQLVALDTEAHRAAVWTGVTAFAPFAATRLALEPSIKVTHIDPDARASHYGYRRHGDANRMRALSIDWSEGQRLAGTWLPARINRRLLYAQPRALRQRLLLSRRGDDLMLVNGLEVAIESLLWRDPQGRLWSAERVEPGAEQVLRAQDEDGSEPLPRRLRELGPVAESAYREAMRTPGQVRARLAAPALPVPGFAGADVELPVGWLIGPLEVEETP